MNAYYLPNQVAPNDDRIKVSNVDPDRFKQGHAVVKAMNGDWVHYEPGEAPKKIKAKMDEANEVADAMRRKRRAQLSTPGSSKWGPFPAMSDGDGGVDGRWDRSI